MDIKTEIEIKDEPFENTQDFRNNGQSFEHDSGIEKIQKKKINPKVEVKEKIEIKSDPLSFTDEYSENDQVDQILGLDEKLEKKNNPKVEIKEEIEINYPFNFTEEYSEKDQVEQITKQDESQEKKVDPKEEVKEEIEIKYYPLDFTEEYSENKQVEHIFKPDQSQTIINGMGKSKKGEKLIVKSSLKCGPETSLKDRQVMREKDLTKTLRTSSNFSLKSKEELKKHLKSHSETKFRCALCSYESKNKGSLKYHTLKHLDVKLLKCPKCSYECNDKAALKCHMLTHVKCPECSFECKGKGNLKRHILTHLKIKLFKCNECNFESNQKRNLRSHILTHAIAIKCKNCNFKSKRQERLRKHELTHSSDEVNKKWTLSRNLYLMESYYIGEFIPMKKDQNKLWKYVVENNKFTAIDYMFYRFVQKFEKVERMEMLKQKHFILNMVSELKWSNKGSKTFSLPLREDLEEIKLKAKNIVENEMEMTVELVENIIQTANDNRCKYQKKQMPTPTPPHVKEKNCNGSKEGSEDEFNQKRKKERDIQHEIDEKIWKKVRVRNIFQ